MATTLHVLTPNLTVHTELSAHHLDTEMRRPVHSLGPHLSVLKELSDARRETSGARSAPARYTAVAPLLEIDEIPPGSPEPWQLVAPVRPDTPHVRALRVLDAVGEAFAALVLIAGGATATALATLL